MGHNDGLLKVRPATPAGCKGGVAVRLWQAGMVFHFIPWFQKYDEPSGPIGLSDTVLVTAEGGKRFGKLPLKITLLRG